MCGGGGGGGGGVLIFSIYKDWADFWGHFLISIFLWVLGKNDYFFIFFFWGGGGG